MLVIDRENWANRLAFGTAVCVVISSIYYVGFFFAFDLQLVRLVSPTDLTLNALYIFPIAFAYYQFEQYFLQNKFDKPIKEPLGKPFFVILFICTSIIILNFLFQKPSLWALASLNVIYFRYCISIITQKEKLFNIFSIRFRRGIVLISFGVMLFLNGFSRALSIINATSESNFRLCMEECFDRRLLALLSNYVITVEGDRLVRVTPIGEVVSMERHTTATNAPLLTWDSFFP